MKKFLLIATAFVALTAFTTIGTWTNDDPHSQLGFTVTHLGIADVSGTFNDLDVHVQSSKADFSDASFELTAKTASIDTRVDARNNHLKSADFFDVEKFPISAFVITQVASENINVTGILTIKGIMQTVTFPVKMEVKGGVVTAIGNVIIDRTKWDVRYKSGKFYDIIADETVSDDIEFLMKVVAGKK